MGKVQIVFMDQPISETALITLTREKSCKKAKNLKTSIPKLSDMFWYCKGRIPGVWYF
jgi:hypothetical protein